MITHVDLVLTFRSGHEATYTRVSPDDAEKLTGALERVQGTAPLIVQFKFLPTTLTDVHVATVRAAELAAIVVRPWPRQNS